MTTSTDSSRATVTAPEAVLWDFDGTLVDTEPLWLAAEVSVVEANGGVWSEQDAREHIGWPIPRTARVLLDSMAAQGLQVSQTVEEVIEQIVEQVTSRLHDGEFVWRPGARELLLELHGAGVRCALVSMSFRRTLEAVLHALPEGVFEVIVAGDEVSRGKPEPDPYLLAAEKLDVDIEGCIVMEDSIPGTASGLASGAAVVAVENLVSLAPGGRSVVLTSLDQVTMDRLFEIAPLVSDDQASTDQASSDQASSDQASTQQEGTA